MLSGGNAVALVSFPETCYHHSIRFVLYTGCSWLRCFFTGGGLSTGGAKNEQVQAKGRVSKQPLA
jgi:hypothetical protein